MVLLRNAVHSALSLVATMCSLGTFYLIEQGPFLGLVQIIVYTGAIMILFLFVLMLVGRDASDSLVETLRGQRWAAALFGIGVRAAGRASRSAARSTASSRRTSTRPTRTARTSTSIAELLFTKYLFAFELTSALLIVAAVGAMVLAHVERDGPKPTQKALARERIRSGRPQPLPGPGVLLAPATRSARRRCCRTARSRRSRSWPSAREPDERRPRPRSSVDRELARHCEASEPMTPTYYLVLSARRCSRSAPSACSCAATRSSCSCASS